MWLFEFLLKLYPAGFRAEYGRLMEQQLAEELREAESGLDRLWLVMKTLFEMIWIWPQLAGAEFAQDAKYGWRSWRKRFGITLLAVLSLGMAIGVSTGVFSVLNAVLFRSLPFREPERLVHFETYFAPVDKGPAGLAEWRASHPFLSEAGVFSTSEFNLKLATSSLRVNSTETTADFFRMLGAPLLLGRDFLPEEEQIGKGGVVILSHALYEQAFGGDSRMLGQKVILNGAPLTVIGVAAPGFDYPHNAALWSPTVFDIARIPKSGVSATTTVGRLRDGISMGEARAAFAVISPRHQHEFWANDPDTPQAKLKPLREELGGPVSRATQVLFAGVCAVLLIACANLAHLFLSRFRERSDEFRIRGWLGAGTARITQQILTECVLLALSSGVAGLGVGYLVAHGGTYYFPPVFAFQDYAVWDARVLLFAFGVSLACGVIFGLVPVILRGKQSRMTNRVRLSMLGAQAGLTVLLLLGSIDLGNGLLHLYRLDLGYQTASIETATISLAGTVHETDTGKRDYLRKCLEAIRRTGLAESVGAIDYLPLSANSFMAGRYQVQSRRESHLAVQLSASSGLVESLGGTLLAGRDFRPEDKMNSLPVAIVNESFAKLDGGIEKVIGRKLRFGKEYPSKEKESTIVGVVKDFRFAGPVEATIATVIRPLEQAPSNFFTIVARPKSETRSLGNLLKSSLAGVDANVPVYDVMPFAKRLERSMARPNFFAVVMLFFGGFSLLLTVIHGYGLCASTLEQRKREMGIRAALGATPHQLRWLVVREMSPAFLAGIGGGLLLSLYTMSALNELIEGIGFAPAIWRFSGVLTLAVAAGMSIWLKTRGLKWMSPADQIRPD